MKCDRCESEVLRMTFRDGDFGCEFCSPVDGQFSGGTIVRGENKFAPQMTRAEIMHIKTRNIGRDGRIHSAPRYETKNF